MQPYYRTEHKSHGFLKIKYLAEFCACSRKPLKESIYFLLPLGVFYSRADLERCCYWLTQQDKNEPQSFQLSVIAHSLKIAYLSMCFTQEYINFHIYMKKKYIYIHSGKCGGFVTCQLS